MSCDICELCGETRHPRVHHCPVSGHTGLLFHDIVDRPAPIEAEVDTVGVELQLPWELAVGGEDSHFGAGD